MPPRGGKGVKNKACGYSITINSTFSDTVIRNRRKGRGAKPLIIPIHPEMLDYFEERCSKSLSDAFVFINPRTGGHYGECAIDGVWDRVRKKGDLPKSLRLYDATRHSVGSQLANQNVSTFIVSKALGHSSTKTTERYMHDSMEGLKSAYDKLSLKDKIKDLKPSLKTVTKSSPG
ncbi:MAG: tyrosine-type recombinase/integrase [Nitrospirae bacterium]|nr:tyrosine-type recombinase/integrase [Nitrospirota bacterium]